MTEELFDHLVYSKNVIEFVTVANEYCSFVENNANLNRSQFVEKTQKLFPLLYLKISMLPSIDDQEIDTPEKYVTEVDYNYLLNKISEKLAQFDSYQEVFDDGMQFSEAAIDASLSENICDIYQDLKDFLLSYRIGTVEVMLDALLECQNNFKIYWGQKLVNGLRALHTLLYSDIDLEEDKSFSFAKEENDDKESWVSKHFNNYSEEDS